MRLAAQVGFAIFAMMLVAVALGQIIAAVAKHHSRTAVSNQPPERAVVKRETVTDDPATHVEHVTLECGHEFLLKAWRRTSWPCTECRKVPTEVRTAEARK